MTGPRLVLVGAPGAGKTSVGAEVAARTGWVHIDTDALVEARAGATVADLFIRHGEEHFRTLERAAVAEALAVPGSVVSTGGGAVLDPETRTRLVGLPVVWLTVGAAAAAPRVGLDAPRPLLALQPRAAWRALLQAREPLYREAARWEVGTDDTDVPGVADRVLEALRWVP